MKTLMAFLILFFALPGFSSDIILTLGESKTIPLSGNQVWIQDRDILSAEVLGSSLKLTAKKEGATHVKVGTAFYDTQVIHPLKKQHYEKFKSIIATCVGLQASLEDGQIVVQGNLYKFSDWIKISEFSKRHRVSYSMQAKIKKALQEQMQSYIASLLEDTRNAPQNIIMEPRLEARLKGSDTLLSTHKKMLGVFGITVIKDDLSLEIAPTIKVEITIAEVKKDKALVYGLKWPPNYSASIMPDGIFQPDALNFSLNAFEKGGLAKILASPNIIARSGEQAEFVAGGEFPIKIMNFKMQDIIWKRYGILLRVKPKADSSGRMSISLETEVSTIDPSREVDGIPGLFTNRVSSHFDISRPQVIALSGLLKNEDSNSSEGLPGLSRLPVIGALFSSKDFKENKSELVIFVRPSILSEKEAGKSQLTHLQE